MSGIDITIAPDPSSSNEDLVCTLHFLENDMAGCDAELSIISEVLVQDSEPVNYKKTILKKKFSVTGELVTLQLPREELKFFSYAGKNITIMHSIKIVVDDSIFFDSKNIKAFTRTPGQKQKVSEVSGSLSSPKDKVNFKINVKALPIKKQRIVMSLVYFRWLFFLALMFFAVHDLWVGRELSYIYDIYFTDSDGRIFLIIFVTIFTSIINFVAAYLLIRRELSSWIKINLNKARLPILLPLDGTCQVSDLITGRASIPVGKILVRIVACNMEEGQYMRGSGTDRRTVSFSRPIREIIVFEKEIIDIRPGEEIGNRLKHEICFNDIYTKLYPEYRLSSSHGLGLHWEIQFLHKSFVDHQINLPTKSFSNNLFYGQ